MIVLPCISQRKFITKGDTLVAYNSYENRRIAILLYEGETYKKLYNVDSVTIDNLHNIVYDYKKQVSLLNQTVALQEAQKSNLNNRVDILTDKLNKSEKSKGLWFKTTVGLSVITLLLILTH